jgi:flagellar motor switch protein FliM
MTVSRTSETMEQAEIDRLLSGVGGSTTLSRSSAVDLQVYDFRRPHRVSKERLRTLEVMYERLVKSLEGWLMARVRGQIELRLQSVEQISFGEYSLFLNSPCCSYLVSIKDAGGQQGVIDFGTELAYFLVDRLFGGGGDPTILERALSPIERMALQVVAERVMQGVQEIWREQEELEMELSGFESIPETMQAVGREDPVLVVTLAASFAEKTSMLSICLPLGVLEKFFVVAGNGKKVNLTSIGSARELIANRENTEAQLRSTSVPVRARLPEFRLSMRDIAGLTAGTVLATGIPTDAPILTFIGSTPRFQCTAGWVGRKLAVRVMESLDAPVQGAQTKQAE